MIKAIASLEDTFDLTLDLVGGGTSKDIRSLQLLASDELLNPSVVQFHPFVRQDELPHFLCNTDIFIFASSCENMPNTLIEAMSVGLPIVCSDRGPMPEILLDGGLYFNPENHLSLASALKVLISSYQLRLDLADRAKTLSESYSWSRCTNELLAFTKSTYDVIN